MNRVFNVVEEIEKLRGYNTAIMTTYNFDIEYFEKYILNRLINAGIRIIYIFVDYKQFCSSIKNLQSFHLGRNYIVKPIMMNSSFHPKVSLFLGEGKAKAIVGSGNITFSGYMINNEIFNEIIFDNDHKENLSSILDIIDFVKSLDKLSFNNGEDQLLKHISNFRYHNYKTSLISDKIFLSNINDSFLNQVRNLIPEKINEIHISCPYYDNELDTYKLFKETFNAQCIVYVQNIKSKFPVTYNKDKLVIEDKNLVVFDKINALDNNNFYHGKVFLFKSDTCDYILYGSANCTLAAINKSYLENGNIEACIFEKGEVNEFDDYFLFFDRISDNEQFKCLPIIYDNKENQKVFYLYGHYDKEFIAKMRIDKSIDVDDIKVNDRSVSYSKDNDIYTIRIDSEISFNSTIFNITVISKDNSYTTIGWFIHYPNIKMSFISVNKQHLFNIDEDKKYLEYEDYYEIMLNMNTSIDKIKKYKELKQKIDQQLSLEEDEGEYVVDISEDEEYFNEKKKQDKLHSIIHIQTIKLLDEYRNYKPSHHDENDEKNTKEITNEDRFYKDVKKYCNNIINEFFVKQLSLEEYMNNVVYFQSLLFMLIENDHISLDLYENSKCMDLKTVYSYLRKILVNVIQHESIETISDNHKDIIIYLSLFSIIVGYSISNHHASYNTFLHNKNIINCIDKLFDIADIYEQYLSGVLLKYHYMKYKMVPDDYESKCIVYQKYILSLFDRVTDKRLIEFLNKNYKDNYSLKTINNEIYIEIIVKNIFEKDRNVKACRELIKYYKEKPTTIRLLYTKIPDKKDQDKYAVVNELVIDNKSRVKQYIHRKDGSVDNEQYFDIY